MKKLLFTCLFLMISITSFAQDKMTNQSILDLIDLGFSSDVIISKINSSDVAFDTSLQSLKELKGKGVSSEIMSLMIEKSKVVIEDGIFFYENKNLKKIQPSVFSGTKANALASALTYGLASAKVKSYVPNAHSSNKVNNDNVVFIFQFDKNSKSELGSGNWWFKTASSPNEFVLTQLTSLDGKNQRELVTGKVSALGGSQIGIDTKNTIPFSIEDLGNGKFKVVSKNKLEPGEYCFFYQGSTPAGGFNNQSIFDFSVL